MTERRAVGGPVGQGLLTAYFGVGLAAWIAATVVGILAADELAAGNPLAQEPILAVHLLALGALPFAVSGASFHLLPVMLRNDLPSQRALWVALVLLCGAFPLAWGVAGDVAPAVWAGASLLTCGLAVVLWEIGTLVVRAPRGRMLVASRAGVALSCAHVVAALCLGALIFSQGRPFWGLGYGSWLLIHLHVALLGWIALLVVAVGRSLGPMLAMAPTAGARKRPVDELALTGGLWLLLTGLGAGVRALTLAGAVVVVLALARFGMLTARVARTRRGPLEAPLAHLLVGAVCLVQAAGTGLAAAAGGRTWRFVSGYVVLLLVGWAGGVVLGHAGKLLALSVWVWWPPGPRPKQAELYPRRLGLGAAALFAVGVEALAIGVFAGSAACARAGAAVLCASAVLTGAGAAFTWLRRPR